jgi:hypothetical protein
MFVIKTIFTKESSIELAWELNLFSHRKKKKANNKFIFSLILSKLIISVDNCAVGTY